MDNKINLSDINLEEQSFEDLVGLQKSLTSFLKEKRVEVKALLKLQKEENRDAIGLLGKEIVNTAGVGGHVNFSYKGIVIEAEVIKIAEKTFTTRVADVEKPVWRYYHQVDIPAVEASNDSETE